MKSRYGGRVTDADPWVPLSGPAHRIALHVLLDGPLSRAELARRMDMSAGSLTRLTKPLIDAGLLIEVDAAGESRVGRPSQPLDVVPDAHHFVGIKVTADTVYGTVTDLRARDVAIGSLPLEDRSPLGVTDAVARLTDDLTAAAGVEVTALGVTLGGHIEAPDRIVRAPFLEWEDVQLGDLLRRRTGLPTVVANDVLSLTEAVHWFGAGRGTPTFAVLTMGAGVGYGLVAHDRMVANPETSLGMLSHFPLDPNGPLCQQGHRGCADAMLTIDSITNQVAVPLGRPLDYDEVLDRAAGGHLLASEVVNASGRALGTMIAAIANLTTAQCIVLGGEGVRLADVARDAMVEGLHAGRDPLATDPTIESLSPSWDEWSRGAAVVAIQTFVLGTGKPDSARGGGHR